MKTRVSLGLLLGLACGLGLGWYLFAHESRPASVQGGLQSPPAHSAPGHSGSDGQTLDPKRAAPESARTTLADLNGMRSEFEQSLGLFNLLAPLGGDEIVALIEAAKHTISGRDYVAATSIMYGRLAELDFETALSHALNANDSARDRWIQSIFHTMARLDFERAVAAMEDLGARHKHIAGQALLASRDDMPLHDRIEVAQDLNVALPVDVHAQDLPTAWSQALQNPNMQQRMMQLIAIARQWGAQDPLAALEASRDLPHVMRASVQATIGAEWASTDPQAAWAWLRELPPSNNRDMLIQTVFGALAQSNLDQALSLARSLEGERRTHALRALLMPWMQRDPDDAVTWLQTLPPGGERMELISHAAVGLAMHDAELTARLRESLSTDERRLLDATRWSILASQDPRTAMLEVEQFDDAQQRTQAIKQVLQHWAGNDYRAALDWVESQPGREREAYYPEVVGNWARWEPQAALDYARRLPSSDGRDQSLLAITLRSDDIDLAEQAYRAIDGAEVRQQLGQTIYRKYRRAFPERVAPYARDAAAAPDTQQPRVRVR